MAVAAAAARFKVSRNTVYEAWKAHNVHFTAGGVGKAAETARIVSAILASKCREPNALARQIGVPYWKIDDTCRRLGIRLEPASTSKHARGLTARRAARERLLPQVDRLCKTPRTRRALRLLLTTDWTMARIGQVCGMDRRGVNELWRRARA
jgi:hypothetical protein